MLFSRLAQYFKRIEATTSRNAITEILADLFRTAHSDEIDKIVYLLQGRVVPLYEAVEFGVADKFVIRAIAKAYGKGPDSVTREFKKEGDVGKAAEKMAGTKGQKISVAEVYEKLYELATTGGVGSQEKKITILLQKLPNFLVSLEWQFLKKLNLVKYTQKKLVEITLFQKKNILLF